MRPRLEDSDIEIILSHVLQRCELCVSVCLCVREGDSGAAPVGVEATCACAPVCRSPVHAYACASALLFSCDCADLCSNHLLLGGYACFSLQEHQECL